MSCYTFGHMRGALTIVSSRPQQAAAQPRLSLPAFSGLHSCASLPSCLSTVSTSHSLQSAPQNGSKLLMMRHGKRIARLGRPADQRKALIRNLTTDVLKYGRITTTQVKAKAIRKYVDKMITLAKRNTLHARRQVEAFVYDKATIRTMFEKVPEMYAHRASGYTKIIKLERPRRGDSAPMAVIKLLDFDDEE